MELGAVDVQGDLEIAQAASARDLGEGHTEGLGEAGRAHMTPTVLSPYMVVEGVERRMVNP